VLQDYLRTPQSGLVWRDDPLETSGLCGIVESYDCVPLLYAKRLIWREAEPYSLALSIEGVEVNQGDHSEGTGG